MNFDNKRVRFGCAHTLEIIAVGSNTSFAFTTDYCIIKLNLVGYWPFVFFSVKNRIVEHRLRLCIMYKNGHLKDWSQRYHSSKKRIHNDIYLARELTFN